MKQAEVPGFEEFLDRARQWLSANVNPRQARGALVWGNGTDKVSLFRDSSPEEERAQLNEVLAWQRTKFDAGLIVTAGTINPHLPRRAIPSEEIPAWLESDSRPDTRDPEDAHGPPKKTD